MSTGKQIETALRLNRLVRIFVWLLYAADKNIICTILWAWPPPADYDEFV